MLQFRCTGNAQKGLSIKPSELKEIKESDSLLGNWYVNMTTIDRRKVILFMNEKTLYSFMAVGVKKSNISLIHETFIILLEKLLTNDGIDQDKIIRTTDEYLEFEYTKTNSRTLLGNMNDIMSFYKHMIYSSCSNLKDCDLLEIINNINRTPQRNIGWKYSVDAMRELITNC